MVHSLKYFAAGVRDTGAYWLVRWVDLRAFLVKQWKEKCLVPVTHLKTSHYTDWTILAPNCYVMLFMYV